MVLNKKTADKPAASAVLLQLAESDKLPAQAKSMVAAFIGVMGKDFMGEMGPGMDYAAPEANAYEFQSGGIIDMLKKLKDEFRTKLADCQKEEMNFTKARKEEKAASDKKELASTKTMKAEDEKTLSDMQVECKEKQLSFDEKQKLRAEEIEAIQQATKILKSGDVPGAALAQGASFGQLRSSASSYGSRVQG